MATENQKIVFNRIIKKVEKGGKISVSGEMKGVYKKATCKNPSKVTKTKGWNQLMNEYLPDSMLAERHKAMLTTPIKFRRYIKGDLETEEESLDVQAVGKGLDMAYKLKGRYKEEKSEETKGIDQTLESVNTLVKMLNEERSKNK